MNKLLLVIVCACMVWGCQKHHPAVPASSVPPPTHEAPTNPIDEELVDWKPFGQNVDKNSPQFKKYAQHFLPFDQGTLKNRIVVFADDEAKMLSTKLKMALFSSGRFVIMERNTKKLRVALQDTSPENLKQLSTALYAQYLLKLNAEDQTKFQLYNLTQGNVIEQGNIAEDVLPTASKIVDGVAKKPWEGKVASEVTSDNKVVLNVGALDNVKPGDSFKINDVELDAELEEEPLLVIEEIEDKYATARLRGAGKVSKGMNIRKNL